MSGFSLFCRALPCNPLEDCVLQTSYMGGFSDQVTYLGGLGDAVHQRGVGQSPRVHADVSCRRSSKRHALTLIEVLLAMVLVGGLMAVLLRGWVDLQHAMLTTQKQWHQLITREERLILVEELFIHLLPGKDQPTLTWDGQRLLGKTAGGYHEKVQLSGPILFTLAPTSDGLKCFLKSDPGLWGEQGLAQEGTVWPQLEQMDVRVFARQEDGSWGWSKGPFELKTLPLFIELTGQGVVPLECSIRVLGA